MYATSCSKPFQIHRCMSHGLRRDETRQKLLVTLYPFQLMWMGQTILIDSTIDCLPAASFTVLALSPLQLGHEHGLGSLVYHAQSDASSIKLKPSHC